MNVSIDRSIDDIKEKFDNAITRIDELEDDVSEKQKQVDDHAFTIEKLEDYITDLKDQISKKDAEIASLATQLE